MKPRDGEPVKRRVRWRRLAAWLLAAGLLLVLVSAGAVWWLWSHRVAYINRSLGALGPLRGSVEDVTLTTQGASLRGFELRDAKTDDLILRLPELSVTGGARDAWHKRVKQVALNDAEITIREPFLEQLLDQKENGESPEGITLPGGWTIDHVELRNVRLAYVERDGTREEIVANFRAEDAATDGEGALSVGEQELTVSAGAVARGGNPPLKLQELRARGRVHDGLVELDELSLSKPVLALTPEFLDFLTPDSPSAAKAPDAVKKPSAQRRAASFVHGLRIGRVRFDNVEFSAAGFTPGNIAGIVLPDAKGRVSYETTDFEWSEGGSFSPGTQWLRIEHLEIKPPVGAGSIACRSVNLAVQPPQDGRWTVEELLLREPQIVWTPELRRLLMPPGNPSPEGAGDGAPPESRPWSVLVQSAAVRDARLSFADAEMVPFESRGTMALSARDLLIDGKGAHSAEAQSLEVADVALGFPGKTPFFELERGEFAVKPDAWAGSKGVEKLVLAKPVLRMRGGNTPWFAAGTAGSSGSRAGGTAPGEDKPAGKPAGAPFWQEIHFGMLAITDGTLDFAETQNGHAVDTQARLNVTTDAATPGLHRVRFEDFEARLPGLTLFPFPVARVSFIECAASLPELWTRRRLESLRIGGANIEVSEALMKFFEGPPPMTEAAKDGLKSGVKGSKPAERDAAPAPEWTVGDLNIADSLVTLDKLVPGMDAVKFEVSLDIRDVPLSPEGLAEDVASQRVELSNLLVPSPYGGPPVARLDSVFVSFSPAGLVKKQIDKVEIVSPTLFIGEPLFWYVDFYRKFAQNAAKGPEARIASADHLFALEAAAAAAAAEPKLSEAGWNVRTLAVHRGKLVLAPKGVPLAGFRTPFPFSFTSEVSRGTLEADFEIPPDNYELPDIKLAFEGLSGKVQFNLPVKGKDNNVTETFQVKRIRWKEMHLEDAFLSVTYDAAGIYGKFGGSAYEGYVNGEFNIYLDDVYSWDGWIGGKDVQTREITQKLLPGTFFMEGKIAAHLIALGDGKEVYEADGKFDNRTPGKLSIGALNDLIKKLPESLSGLKQQFTQIGLETLRDFAYDQVSGQFRTYGREGRGALRFTGPTGSRNFEINAYDHRWKTDQPKDGTKAVAQ